MDRLHFIYAIHNHQPVGNFDTVFEEAYVHAYRPFLDVLHRHPGVKSTQHWTGILLEWLEQHHPECIELLRDLVQRGQVELLTGAYYEAILAVIPEKDRIGQIIKLTDMIHRLFDVHPRGMWLAERVWEPHLVSSLVRADVEFVMLDDLHFRHAGVPADRLAGYYMTEELGLQLKVLPMDKTLRYTIPFRDVGDTLDHLRTTAAAHPGGLIVHADDGEKFGVWPRTFAHVYEHGWLERFYTALEDPSLPVQMMHAGEVIDTVEPQGIVYLPADSYVEMTLWALPAHDQVSFAQFEKQVTDAGVISGHDHHLRGGFWRNFLAKYPEANHMHKKMLRLSRRMESVSREHKVPEKVRDHLWASQCNDPYWHGLFGGLYLPALRFNIYRHLLAAEHGLDGIQKFRDIVVEETDFDGDGANELVVESRVNDYCFKPSLGGCLVEWSNKPGGVNLLDVISRREEGTHRKLREAGQGGGNRGTWDELLSKEPDLLSRLFFDWYRHASFLDHVLGEDVTLERFARASYGELGDFVNQPYHATVSTEGEHVLIALHRKGGVWRNGVRHALAITKTFTLAPPDGVLSVGYTLENLEAGPLDLRFAVEIVAGGMAGSAADRYYLINGRKPTECILQSAGTEKDVQRFGVRDEWMGVTLEYALDRKAELWRFPIETVSLSESGFERLYQGSVLLPSWRVPLGGAGCGGGERWTLRIETTVEHR
jgi:4-alpha-glucanotransferase